MYVQYTFECAVYREGTVYCAMYSECKVYREGTVNCKMYSE